jgi:hypothetical protein|tara:strand:- start:4017 stop:5174 length:1158 start_codon:yes stop_codon:yes gene_type:complete
MYMPRLSLYRPEKSNDYTFLDSIIYEQFTVGGTDLFVHKYIGTKNPTGEDITEEQKAYATQDVTNIQDLLFLENRDRKYDQDIYTLRGHYNVQDQDFDLSQFGLFMSNDTLFMTIHINSSVKTLGRKIISGDVIELPHLKDEYALNDYSVSLKRFYVVEDVNRAAEGFSQSWYPHLYRLKLKQIYDGQEYKDILDLPVEEGSEQTLRDVLSTYEKEMQINDAVVAQAEKNTPSAGYDTSHFYTISVRDNGEVDLVTADETFLVDQNVDVTQIVSTPPRTGYPGYLVGDGIPPNGAPFGSGTGFPSNSALGDYFLRTDFIPNRLFRYDGNSWRKVEDKVRTTLTPNLLRDTLKGTFVNNNASNEINGEEVVERQSLSKALRPKADN